MFDRALDCLAPHDAADARPVHLVTAESLAARAEALGASAWVTQTGYRARPGEVALLPGPEGVAAALLGAGAAGDPFVFAALPGALPAGRWRIAGADAAPPDAGDAVLGFGLGAYRFESFRAVVEGGGAGVGNRPLLVDPGGDGLGAAQARAIWLARDLINMPANRLGPRELAEAAMQVCDGFGAVSAIVAGEVLAREYPAVHAVGRGSSRPPMVFCSSWSGSAAGPHAPLLSLVGKGVCFDTGGYDLKPAAAMLRMKKDMGGAAIMLALARLIMDRDLPVRLQLRIGCVENSISGDAMRPSDVIATRHGLHVEIGNTDAEGRLVLCDLLAEACEHRPTWLIDAATLTGAARVALGPDLPALFSNDDELAGALLRGGESVHDRLWRMPLHDPYDAWLASNVADLNNISSKPMAGAVVAALFLRRFVSGAVAWAHLDTYAWNDASVPGRPEGGDAQGLRAVFSALLRIIKVQHAEDISVT